MTDSNADKSSPHRAMREVSSLGVQFVVSEAMRHGYVHGHPDWSNLGPGQPEVGEMRGAPPRVDAIEIHPEDHAYGPIEGTPELRDCVAAHYNRLYRRGKKSQYTAANVAVTSGVRLALSRAMAALGAARVGYRLPDSAAFEDLLDLHVARLSPLPLRTREEDGFLLTPERLERDVVEHGLGAFVLSNPCNPTGHVVGGADLEALVGIARQHRMTFLLDEIHSHFIYDGAPGTGPVSGAVCVADVNADPVLLFDGLTMNYRYPGWRVGWVVGPRDMVESIARTGSAIDGGASRWAQRAALEVLDPERADLETDALRRVFAEKRNVMVRRLEEMGVTFACEPNASLYCWGCLRDLPPPLNDAFTFFRRALDKKLLTVPGPLFDVNPGERRQGPSPYESWMRFSFGPPMDNMQMGLDRLQEMIGEAR